MSSWRCISIAFGFFVFLFLCQNAYSVDGMDPLFGPSVVELKEAAARGDAIAQYKVGSAYAGHSDRTNAIVWYRKSSRQGNVDAQYALGGLLMPSSESVGEGMKWLLRAANQNHISAQIEMGHIFERGKELKQDKVEA